MLPYFVCNTKTKHETFKQTNQHLVINAPLASSRLASPRFAQESAQFSAMAVELSDSDTVGTALTLQMALGFSVTVVGIFTIPLVEVCTWIQITVCNALGLPSSGRAHSMSPQWIASKSFCFSVLYPRCCSVWTGCG